MAQKYETRKVKAGTNATKAQVAKAEKEGFQVYSRTSKYVRLRKPVDEKKGEK